MIVFFTIIAILMFFFILFVLGDDDYSVAAKSVAYFALTTSLALIAVGCYVVAHFVIKYW